MTCLLSKDGVPVSVEVAFMASAEPFTRSQRAALPSRVQVDAVVRFAALGFEAEIACAAAGAKAIWACDDLWIKERRAHVKERGGEQNALARFILGADFGLAGEERREKLAAIVGPPRPLRTQRQHDAVVAIERKVLDRVESDCVLRQPNGLTQ